MRIHIVLLSLVLLFSLFSCGNAATSSTNEKKPIKASAEFSGLPLDIKQNLMTNCDYIDYTFYDFNFSMSQSTPVAIKANLALLSDEVQVSIPAECKPIGRKMYHINGEIVMEAELYFGEGCLFYIYKDGHTPLYGNKLSQKGVNFYGNIIQQASKARQQQVGN